MLKILRERLIEEFKQQWSSMLDISQRYSLYRQMKVDFCTERYLYVLDKKIFRDGMIKFRMGISALYIHRHRYIQGNIETLCPICREADEDERHFLLYCPALYDLKIKYLIPLIRWEEDEPFTQLLCNSEAVVIRGVATFLYHAFKRREEALSEEVHNSFFID